MLLYIDYSLDVWCGPVNMIVLLWLVRICTTPMITLNFLISSYIIPVAYPTDAPRNEQIHAIVSSSVYIVIPPLTGSECRTCPKVRWTFWAVLPRLVPCALYIPLFFFLNIDDVIDDCTKFGEEPFLDNGGLLRRWYRATQYFWE